MISIRILYLLIDLLTYLSFKPFLKDFILLLFILRERGKEGERENVWLPLSSTLYWGPGPQPRHVPWLGVKQQTLWISGQRSIHWATAARGRTLYLKKPDSGRINSSDSSVSLVLYDVLTFKAYNIFLFKFLRRAVFIKSCQLTFSYFYYLFSSRKVYSLSLGKKDTHTHTPKSSQIWILFILQKPSKHHLNSKLTWGVKHLLLSDRIDCANDL